MLALNSVIAQALACYIIFNRISNLQPGGLKDHEKQHEAHGHVLSEDERVRARQKFEKARGRPSIQEMNYDSVKREEAKRKEKGFVGDTGKTIRPLGGDGAAEDEGGQSGEASSVKVRKSPNDWPLFSH